MKEDRYIRQTTLKDFGPGKQEMLQRASVLVVGVGGLGIPVLQYLNAMGVGTLGMVEQDEIEISNLQRQVLYGEGDVGKPKIKVAYEKLRAMNSQTELICHDIFLTRSNALEILSGYDLIIDASDNFGTRYLINDSCVILGKPFVSGAIHGFEGQVSVFNHKDGPTYRCLFPSPPESGSVADCNTHGVLGVIPGIIGSLQAMEAVKVLTGMPGILKGLLLLYNGLDQSIRHIKFSTIPENKARTALEPQYEEPHCSHVPAVEVETLRRELLKNPEKVFVIDIRSDEEFRIDGLQEAVHIPLEDLKSSLNRIPAKKSLYVICKSGSRSQVAVSILLKTLGDTPVYSVQGGMQAWQGKFGVLG